MVLTELSNDELIARLTTICFEAHRRTAALILLLVEVEDRGLHADAAYSSLFDFCVRKLAMSEGAAFRRIVAVKLVRRFPALLERIERGELHLSALVLLADHLTLDNFDELVAAAAGKTKREVEELLARRTAKPDVPSVIRELPVGAPGAAPRIDPLSPDRHKLQLTVSGEVRAKLERARDMMRHRNPSGDLAVVVERALDLLLVRLEKEIHGKANRPPRAPEVASEGEGNGGAIPRAVRRAVFARDGAQCTYVSPDGKRCPCRSFLELDHIVARALGGQNTVENIRVRCRMHNQRYAEQVFGKDFVRRKKLAPAKPRDLRDVATRTETPEGQRAPPVVAAARD